jgi:Ca2+-binding EF-hand superfamily protein
LLVVGGSASMRLNKLRNCLMDDEYLLALFSRYDSDQDGYLSPSDFAKFIMAIGFDFDDSYTLKAFKAIDKNRDLKIRFVDFHKWWSQCSVEGNEVATLKEQEMGSYSKTMIG